MLLDGLHRVQTGEDTRLNNVLVTINGIRCRVKVVVPILYFMNDAKEGDMLCCRVASHNKVNCHCRVCDVQYDDMLDVYVDCSMKESDYIEMLVDAENHATLNNLSQYCIPSCFCGFTFCNPTNRIFGAQPGDMLHMFQLGPVKNCVQIFLDCFTPTQKTICEENTKYDKKLSQLLWYKQLQRTLRKGEG